MSGKLSPMAFACARCFTYGDVQRVGDGPGARYLCADCRERQAEEQLERERRAAAGVTPAICEECRQPFMASRRAVLYCSSSCKSKAWRRQRAAVVS